MTIAVQGAADSSHGEAFSPGPQYDAAQSGPVILEARDLDLRFGAIRALQSVSLTVRANAIHSVIGPNGAGKISLLNCLSGFYRPQSGDVLFGGRSIIRARPHMRAKAGLARTFQGIQTYPSR